MTEEVFRWVVTGGVLLAALSFAVVAIVAVVLLSKIKEVQSKVVPILDAAGPVSRDVLAVVQDLRPKVKAISADAVIMSKHGVEITERAVEIANTARDESRHITLVTHELADRVRMQVSRLDDAIDDTVHQVGMTGDAVKNAVLQPVRRVDGIFSGIRTALNVYAKGRRSRVDSATQDEELFI